MILFLSCFFVFKKFNEAKVRRANEFLWIYNRLSIIFFWRYKKPSYYLTYFPHTNNTKILWQRIFVARGDTKNVSNTQSHTIHSSPSHRYNIILYFIFRSHFSFNNLYIQNVIPAKIFSQILYFKLFASNLTF